MKGVSVARIMQTSRSLYDVLLLYALLYLTDIYDYETTTLPHHSLLHSSPPPPTSHPPPPPHTGYSHSTSSDKVRYEQIYMKSDSKGQRRRRQGRAPISTVISMVMIMMCFVMATPLSLVLTVPAYILADRVRALLVYKM